MMILNVMNPNTIDNVMTYVILTVIGMIAVIGGILFWIAQNKKNKKS